ncbi:MAG: hypothetical protein ABI787_00430 [Spartobacteria bacterium]
MKNPPLRRSFPGRNILRAGCYTLLFLTTLSVAQRSRITEDRELKEIDLTGWDCVDRLEGSAKTPDGLERNRLKNRTAADLLGARVDALDFTAFQRLVAAFDNQTKGKRRKDLTPALKAELDQREQQLVSLTGYLVLAYPGPPESTNCGSTDFHDWHLELFANPSDHPPQAGDPTPIICEISPRTQNALYRAGIRMQSLAAFIRAPDLSYEPTGHPARKIRITGHLLLDDDHNGSADVGPIIQSVGANKYHNPWRVSAWEIHPITKIEVLDSAVPALIPSAAPAGEPTVTPALPIPSPNESSSTPTPPVATLSQQYITLRRPVTIKISYGQTVLPRGIRLPVITRDTQTVTVDYLGKPQVIPLISTDPW